jgi:phosphoglycolate phosphatase-like HAD superfamily hydrolase
MLLILDFDGVICNSIYECWCTTIETYNIFVKGRENNNTIPETDEAVKKLFYQYRFCVRPPGEFFVLLSLIKEYGGVDDIKFVERRETQSLEIEEFGKLFFEIRNKNRKNHLKRWLQLHTPSVDFLEFWNKWGNEKRIYIATNKDLESVMLLLREWEISIRREMVFSKEISNDKRYLLSSILVHEKVQPENALFVDDHIYTLIEAKHLGLKMGLALWGYTYPRSIELSNQNGILMFKNFQEVESYAYG